MFPCFHVEFNKIGSSMKYMVCIANSSGLVNEKFNKRVLYIITTIEPEKNRNRFYGNYYVLRFTSVNFIDGDQGRRERMDK